MSFDRNWHITVVSILIGMQLCAVSNAQLPDTLVYYDFQQGMPDDFLLYDQDGLTPESQVEFVTSSWVVRSGEELGNILDLDPGDRLAVSTSFYLENQISDTILPADDWMILPPIFIPDTGLYTLSWRAGTALETFPDGYEVRISRQGSLPIEFSEVIFEVEEAKEFLERKAVLLDGVKGEQIWIAFRNPSLDKFLLFIDDIAVVNAAQRRSTDLEVVEVIPLDEFTLVPSGQQIPFQLGVKVFNLGPQLVKSLDTDIQINQNEEPYFQEIFSLEDTLLPGDTLEIRVDSVPLHQQKGTYEVSYTIQSTEEEDLDPQNNRLIFNAYALTDTTWARDRVWIDEEFVNATGFQGSQEDEIVIAQLFESRKPDILTSASALLYLPDTFNIGDTVYFAAFSLAGELPIEIGRTEPYVILPEDVSDTSGLFLSLKFPEQIFLNSELFMIGVLHKGENALFVAYTEEVYTPFTNWIRSDSIPNGNWAPIEWFSDSEGSPLRFVWVIQAHITGCATMKTDVLTEHVYENPPGQVIPGKAIAVISGGVSPYSYRWLNALGEVVHEGDSIARELAIGNYVLEISDQRGCIQEVDFVIPGLTHTQEQIDGIIKFNVFPNPFEQILSIDLLFDQPSSFSIQISDLAGKTLKHQTFERYQHYRGEIRVDVSSKGIYLFRLLREDNVVITEMLFKR